MLAHSPHAACLHLRGHWASLPRRSFQDDLDDELHFVQDISAPFQ